MALKLYFDLDGTVYNLYAVKDWDYKLRNSIASVFEEGTVMTDMVALEKKLKKLNVEVGVITWLPREATAEYEAACKEVKMAWVKKYMPYVKEVHALSYGVPKHTVGTEDDILVDDNADVLDAWRAAGRAAINAIYIDRIDEKVKEVLKGVKKYG